MATHRPLAKTAENGTASPWPTFTHCVSCDYESRADFDVCPKCGAREMAVIVLKKA